MLLDIALKDATKRLPTSLIVVSAFRSIAMGEGLAVAMQKLFVLTVALQRTRGMGSLSLLISKYQLV
jgi:hypothetical protein